MAWDFFRKRPSNVPEWYTRYLDVSFVPVIKDINQATFIVLDCETTGLSANDQLISVGAVACTASEINLSNILDQKYPFHSPGKSAEIHGELPEEDVKNTTELLKELLGFLQNHVIVGHNISFDIGIINQHLKQVGAGPLRNKVLDTALLSIRLDPEKYERSVGGKSLLHLDDLCQTYHIPIENRHTALGDAYLTALLFQRVLSKLKKRGIKNMKDLLR